MESLGHFPVSRHFTTFGLLNILIPNPSLQSKFSKFCQSKISKDDSLNYFFFLNHTSDFGFLGFFGFGVLGFFGFGFFKAKKCIYLGFVRTAAQETQIQETLKCVP